MRVAIIGLGKVGSALAYRLAMSPEIAEIVLYDVNKDRALGLFHDLSHAISAGRSDARLILAGRMEEIEDCDVIAVAAGKPRRPDMSRRDLAEVNAQIMKEVAERVAPRNKGALYLVITNPVDAMAMLLWRLTGLNVLGTGTALETSRLISYLSAKLSVPPKEITGFVAGEHGEDAVVLWSTVRVRGKPASELKIDRAEVEGYIKSVPAEIIRLQGGTIWGPAEAFSRIIMDYLRGEPVLHAVSRPMEFPGLGTVYVSVPTAVGLGRDYVLWDELEEEERVMVRKAAESIKKTFERAYNAVRGGLS